MQNFDYKKYTWIAGGIALICTAFASIAIGVSDLRSSKYPNGQQATITVVGEGEASAIPDIATVTMTVRESASTVPAAQKLVEDKTNSAVAAISSLGIEEKDTKTISYTVNPRYETQNIYCTSFSCPPQSTKIVGYEVSQTIEVKVRDIDSAGDVLGAIGGLNITEINGPNFTVDDMDKIMAEAKEKAIEDARGKAIITVNSLGMGLGEIVGFNEDNGYYPMYARDAMGSTGGVSMVKEQSVTLPQGETITKVRVTITYALD